MSAVCELLPQAHRSASRTFLGKALLSRISLARAIGDIEPALDDDESDKTNYRPHNLHNGRRLREPEL